MKKRIETILVAQAADGSDEEILNLGILGFMGFACFTAYVILGLLK